MAAGRADPSAVETALLRKLVDSIPGWSPTWDSSLHCGFANRAYELWFGITPEFLRGRHVPDLLGPLYALSLPHIEAALRGEPQEFEREFPDPAGGACLDVVSSITSRTSPTSRSGLLRHGHGRIGHQAHRAGAAASRRSDSD